MYRGRRFPGIRRFLVVGIALIAGFNSAARVEAQSRMRDVQEIRSTGGIRAWLVEERAVPLIAIRFAFMGGSVQDPAGKEGLGALTAALLSEGAGPFSSEAFARRVADQGARLSVTSGRDRVTGGLDALSRRFEESAELLRLMLTEPRFDGDAIERAKVQHLSSLAIAANEPRTLSLESWYAEAFSDHPYGRPPGGTPQSVGRIVRDDLVAHHKRLFARDTLTVVIVGNIDTKQAGEAIDAIFGHLPSSAATAAVPRAAPRRPSAPVVVSRDVPLSTATFGLAALPPRHPDYAALQVLNHILASGDFDSRLMEEIRVKRGLAYSVQARIQSDSIASLMLGGLATRNEIMGQALGVLRDVLAQTVADGPTPEQFSNAKQYLAGSYLLDFDSNAGMAAALLRIRLAGQAPDLLAHIAAIEKVGLDDVKRVARDILMDDRLVVTVVGQPVLDR